MAENGLEVLVEFSEKYLELASADLPCSLILSDATHSVMGNPVAVPFDLIWQDSLMVLVNETEAMQDLTNKGESLFQKHLFSIWGGVLDLDTDGETPLGRSSIIVPRLKRAMNSGGGVLYGDDLLSVEKFKRGLIIGGVVLEWFLICSGKGFDTI